MMISPKKKEDFQVKYKDQNWSQNRDLERPVTLVEIKDVVKESSALIKAPGPDDFIDIFY